MDNLELQLCDIQGRLFELSVKQGYDSEKFVSYFMTSYVAKALDSEYNRMQWAGEEYMLEELEDSGELEISDNVYPIDVMYWIGYIYRYWHYCKSVTSAEIYSIADVNVLKRNYLMFHTMDPEMAIDDLIEIKRQSDERKKAELLKKLKAETK